MMPGFASTSFPFSTRPCSNHPHPGTAPYSHSVTLLPKTAQPLQWSQTRPIGLLPTFSKLCTGMLLARLVSHIPLYSGGQCCGLGPNCLTLAPPSNTPSTRHLNGVRPASSSRLTSRKPSTISSGTPCLRYCTLGQSRCFLPLQDPCSHQVYF